MCVLLAFRSGLRPSLPLARPPARVGLLLVLLGTVLGCSATPVPELDRAIAKLELAYQSARQLPDPLAEVLEVIRVRQETRVFLGQLDGETEVIPHAEVRASSAYRAGRGMFRLERFDVKAVRRKTETLLRRLDRYLTTAGVRRLEGTGWKLEGGKLVRG